MESFATYFRSLRERTGLTLRQFCAEHGFDPGNMSRIERGRANPPQKHEKLMEWAMALGLAPKSEEWVNFFDHAAISSKNIPSDLLTDEELVGKLPLVFRTLRGEKVSDQGRKDLADLIRGD